MGKLEEHRQLHGQQQQVQGTESTILCQRCSVGISRILRQFNLKCAVTLICSLSVSLPAIFWLLHLHSVQLAFDAKDAIKLRSTVQAHFILEKPVSELVKHIARLEYDIYTEIGIPSTKVAILSMNQSGASNWTIVVFGVLSDPAGVSINPVSLSVLRSSLVDLFLQQYNLTLTTSAFGAPSSFEILKFPGGITIVPEQYASIWQIPQILFNFTLNYSVLDIKEKFPELKEMLKFGLLLRSNENVYVQITSRNGSTIDPPVTVQASVTSVTGSLSPQRLKQLAQTILGSSSPAKNLGLDNSVFGKVKEVSLSSLLNNTLHATPPTPSPAPAPEQNDYGGPSIGPYPGLSPSSSPAPSPVYHHDLSSLPRAKLLISSSLSSSILVLAIGWLSWCGKD